MCLNTTVQFTGLTLEFSARATWPLINKVCTIPNSNLNIIYCNLLVILPSSLSGCCLEEDGFLLNENGKQVMMEWCIRKVCFNVNQIASNETTANVTWLNHKKVSVLWRIIKSKSHTDKWKWYRWCRNFSPSNKQQKNIHFNMTLVFPSNISILLKLNKMKLIYYHNKISII